MKMAIDFETMWHGHSGRINIANHPIKFYPTDEKSIHSAPDLKVPKGRQLDRNKIDEMLSKGAMVPAQSTWAAPTQFKLRGEKFTRSQPSTYVLTRSAIPQSSLRWTKPGNKKSRSRTKIATRPRLSHFTNFITLCGWRLDYEML